MKQMSKQRLVRRIWTRNERRRSRLDNPALNCHAEVIFALMVFRCFQMINLCGCAFFRIFVLHLSNSIQRAVSCEMTGGSGISAAKILIFVRP